VLPKAPVSYNVVRAGLLTSGSHLSGNPVLLATIGSLVSAAAAKHPDMVQGVVMMSLPDRH